MLTYALPVVRWLCGDAARHAVAEAVLLKNVYELLQTVADGPSAIASYVSSAALDVTRTPCVTYAYAYADVCYAYADVCYADVASYVSSVALDVTYAYAYADVC
jgi:hypothetical protein